MFAIALAVSERKGKEFWSALADIPEQANELAVMEDASIATAKAAAEGIGG